MTSDPSRPADVESAVQAATEHHRAGRLVDAERLYGEALAIEPGHVKAAHNLGALYLQRKDLERALPLLAVAAAGDPDGAQTWITYGNGLILAGLYEAAAGLLAARGASPAASGLELRLRQAWGMALLAEGKLAAAEGQFLRARALAPDDADAHADLGLVQLQRERPEAAAANLARALELSPDNLGALVNLGSAEKALGRHEAAEASYRRALALDPGHGPALRNLGVLLAEQGRHADALAAADAALAAQPGQADALMVRGNALNELERLEEAVESYSRVGGSYEALTKMGPVLRRLSRYDEALAVLDEAVAQRPDATLARYLRWPVRLALGDFEGGWRDYETRWGFETFLTEGAGLVPPAVRARLDIDTPLPLRAGERVLLVAEQGIGDTVMFASMIPDMLAAGVQVACLCDPRLIRLFSNAFPAVSFLAEGTTFALSAFDRVLAMGSLGRAYRNRVEDFPGTPYLQPRSEVRDRWAARLGPRPKGLRIGVSWRGGLPWTGRARRSLSLDQLAPVLDLPDCEYVSLQYGDPREEVAAFNAGRRNPMRSFPAAEIDDFEDLAGLIQNLDLVVTVQTSVVHLSGAIGADCLVLIPYNPEWRYAAQATSMPWYDSVRLFRQSKRKAWDPVIKQVTDVLKTRLRAPRS
ncbi:MAG: tetratricopeptide repeat protein [Phenylobacterium sp.]